MIRVALICDQLRVQQQVQSVLEREGFLVLGCLDKPEAVRAHLAEWAPEAILVAEPFGSTDTVELTRQIRTLATSAALLILGKGSDPGRIRLLFRSGADDVLQVPRDLSSVPLAIRETVQSGRNRSGPGISGGKVVVVWSPKGGVGCSLVAANLAVALQVQQRRRTLLADLNSPYGGVDAILALQPERTFADLFRVIDELHAGHVAQACTEHRSGLAVLCAANTPGPLGGLEPVHITNLVRVCRSLFDVTVLDLPSAWVSPVITAVDLADRLLLVVTPDAPAVRSAQVGVGLLPLAKRERQMTGVVVNRVSTRSELQPREIGEMLALPVVATIQSDFVALEPHVNTGQPLISSTPVRAKPSRVAQDLSRLAQRLA